MLAFAGAAFAQTTTTTTVEPTTTTTTSTQATDDDADDDADDDTVVDDDADDDVDDDADDDATTTFEAEVAFSNPVELLPSTPYEFEFTVANTTSLGAVPQWIDGVDFFMPSEDYQLNTTDLFAPDALHLGEWSVEPIMEGADAVGIRWEFTTGVTSLAHGDIKEGEYQEFAFRATTDEDTTDGFDYKVTADSGEYASGTAYIVEPSDDDTGDDDTSEPVSGDDDDEDDESGCCGC